MKFRHKITTAALCFVLAAVLCAGCGKKEIDGSAVVSTVNGEEIPLGMVSFYSRYQQATIYSLYMTSFGMTDFFDGVIEDEGSEEFGLTYGESLRKTALQEIENLYLIRSHAGEYGVSLTDEEKASIEEAAQSYIDSNEEAVKEKIGASKEQIIELMQLLKIREKMRGPMTDNVDRNIDPDSIRQASLTYSRIARSDKGQTPEGGEPQADESSQEYQDALTFLDQMLEMDDPGSADMVELADLVNEDFGTASGHWTVSDPSDTYLNTVLVDAAKDLADGEMVDHVVVTDDAYYVVRKDLNYDEERTNTQTKILISDRRREIFNELLDGWREEAEIVQKADVLAKLVVTDKEPYLMNTMSVGY